MTGSVYHAPPVSQRLTIEGPAGVLEARLDQPVARQNQQAQQASTSSPLSSPGAFAVLCHPHPLFAGTMDNKVVHTLAKACNDLGMPALRFNFRGVGASQGAYADGLGETDDALAVVAEGHRRWPGARVWLGGFSFGAAVAVRAAAQVQPARVVLVAPGVDRVDIAGLMPTCPWLVLLGDADEVVSPARMLEWAAGLQPPPRIQVLPGAGHYFHGRLNDVREVVTGWAAPTS